MSNVKDGLTREQFAAFGEAVFDYLHEHVDEQGEELWDISELAVHVGVCHRAVYDPEKHGECDAEAGEDTITVMGLPR